MTVDLANLDEGIDGVLVSLDAKKAFDSVDHRYIRRCLHAFGLSCFIPIFDVLYKDLRSEIICNGMTVEGYKILRGVKQGDALSCILFIICIEPLLRNIKNNQNIARLESRLLPIELPNSYGFADDVSVITMNDVVTVQSVFDEYELFSNNSGLILNADKTELLFFNRNNDHDKELRIMYRGHQYLLGGMASNIRSLRSVIKVHDLHSSLYCSFFLFSYSSNVNKKCLTHFQLNSESCFLLSRTFFILHS